MTFLMKKKRYKFEVQCCLEELTEVPFVSAVLFAKVRLLDGGNFQDYSTREEVRNHTVQWNAQFSFLCKMCANANTGVLEPARLKISVRKECKGGRTYQKLGFCDVDLAELAGAGETTRRFLLEGYGSSTIPRRQRPDNSVLRIRIKMNMISGDPLFKVPERKQEVTEKTGGDSGSESTAAPDDDCASSTTSSGFGSLTKKKNYEGGHSQALSSLPSCELPSPENEALPPLPALPDYPGVPLPAGAGAGAGVAAGAVAGAGAGAGAGVTAGGCAACMQQHTHSRNSSNTSGDMSSKASGYGSSVSAASAHSRQSSEGDSAGDSARPHHNSVRLERITTTTTSLYVPTHSCKHAGRTLAKLLLEKTILNESAELYVTPNTTLKSPEIYLTPNVTLTGPPDVIPRHALQSPCSDEYRTPETTMTEDSSFAMPTYFDQKKKAASIIGATVEPLTHFHIFKQKSLNTIPALLEKNKKNEELFTNFPFLTPLANRKNSISNANRLSGCIEDEFYCIPSEPEGEAGSHVDVRHRFRSLSHRSLAPPARPHDLRHSVPECGASVDVRGEGVVGVVSVRVCVAQEPVVGLADGVGLGERVAGARARTRPPRAPAARRRAARRVVSRGEHAREPRLAHRRAAGRHRPQAGRRGPRRDVRAAAVHRPRRHGGAGLPPAAAAGAPRLPARRAAPARRQVVYGVSAGLGPRAVQT